jgi:MFS family permease
VTARPVVDDAWNGWPAAARLLHGSFRRLLVGQCLGQAGDGLAQIAFAQFVVFEAGRTTSASRIAVLLAVTLLPFSVVGPFAGVVIDRHRRQRVLVVTSLVRAAIALVVIGTVVFRSQAGALVGLLLLLSMSRFVLAAKGAALPRTVDPVDLVVANALSGLSGMASTFLGAVGGATFVGRSVVSGFVVAAALYTVAALAFAQVPGLGGELVVKRGAHQPTAVLRSGFRDAYAGLGAILGNRALRGPLMAVTAHRMLLGGGFVLLVLITNSRSHLGIAGYGLALAVTGVASLGGTLAAPALARHLPARVWLRLSFLPPAHRLLHRRAVT